MSNNKQSDEKESSADNVDEYLQTLCNEDARERRYYSQEQPFSADEITQIVNEARLIELLAQSDEFLSSVNGEIEDFDENK